MGRRAVHDREALLDAAIELFARGGAQAVTMAALARHCAAPSGSIYHRFPDRAALLAAVWLRTTERFVAELVTVLGDSPDPARGIAAAVWCVDWCRAHDAEAQVLHAGATAFAPEGWSAADRHNWDSDNTALRTLLARTARSVARQAEIRADEAAFAMFDLPLATVRPHLAAGRGIPESASDLVGRLAARILGSPA